MSKNNYYNITDYEELVNLRNKNIRDFLDFFFQNKILKKEIWEPSIFGDDIEANISKMVETRQVNIFRFKIHKSVLTQLNNDFINLVKSTQFETEIENKRIFFDNNYKLSINKEKYLNSELEKQEKIIKEHIEIFPDIKFDKLFINGELSHVELKNFISKRKDDFNIPMNPMHLEEYLVGRYDINMSLQRMSFYARLYYFLVSLYYFYFLKSSIKTKDKEEKEENVPEGYDSDIFKNTLVYKLYEEFVTREDKSNKVKQKDWIYIYRIMKKEKFIKPCVTEKQYIDWSSEHPTLKYNFTDYRMRKQNSSSTYNEKLRYERIKKELNIE